MTDSDIDRIARSFIGHFASELRVREGVRGAFARGVTEAQRDERIASLINEHVRPEPPVTAADVGDINARIEAILGGMPINATRFDANVRGTGYGPNPGDGAT